MVVGGQHGGEVDLLLLDGVDHGLRGHGVHYGGLLGGVVDQLERNTSCATPPHAIPVPQLTRYM